MQNVNKSLFNRKSVTKTENSAVGQSDLELHVNQDKILAGNNAVQMVIPQIII